VSGVDFPVLTRLAAVEAIHVRVPFRRPLLDATGEYTHRRVWLLRLVDEDGREGLGEAALNPFAEETLTGALAAMMRELVPALAEGRLPVPADLAAEGEAGRAVIAALDGALTSLRATAGRMSGATPAPSLEPIAVSASIPFGGPDAGADAAAQAVELGFRTLKLRAGFERTTEQLTDRLRAIRGAIGPEPRLRVDAGGAWSPDTAAERIAAIEPFRIEYVEQPLAVREIAAHAALRERMRVPIALDEDVESEGAARAALAEGAADVLIVKPVRVGGLAAVTRIVEAASRGGVTVVLGTHFETGVGIAAALRVAAALRGRSARGGPPAHGLATAGILVHDLLTTPLPIEHGRIAIPQAVSLDEAELARYTIERFEVRR
jgi:o-succinylbenzoate synthase